MPGKISAIILWLLFLPVCGNAQIQIGTIKGIVTDPAGAVITNAQVRIINPVTGERTESVTSQEGTFIFHNVTFQHYGLVVTASGFNPVTQSITVNSNLPLMLKVQLSVAGSSAAINVTAADELVTATATSSAVELPEKFIQLTARLNRGRQLQELIVTTPGWATENNGLAHVRGVDDGILYVVDGVPIADRLDAVSASAFDPDTIDSLQILTGHFPAEFGGRSGAVVIIQPKSGIDDELQGSLRLGGGDFHTGDLAVALGSNFRRQSGVFLNAATHRSRRFLDPVDPRNFNNRGGSLNLSLRADWQMTGRDLMLINVSGNGTDFHVPNDLLQEVTGQRQRQELRDYSLTTSWQHVWSARTVINAALFHRRHQSQLFGSEHDIPLFAAQDRAHTRTGLIASLTHQRGRHTFKTGLEAARIAPRELFTFFVTDEAAAADREVSEEALEFTAENPFIFRDSVVRHQTSLYVQDAFSPLNNLTINAGLRFDRTTLLVADHQFSPRLAAVYYLSATRTALRASFNRLFQPPQVDNLLLSASDQARHLSPFVNDNGGGAEIRPERISAYEVGVAQDIAGRVRFDLALWRRDFRNVGDPNVFFNTTIIFPNSVARGFSRGLDVRLDVPERRGWSGWLSYTNMRILQTGPLNGGLFLTEEFLEIGPGTRFIPDQDQRNTGGFGITYSQQRSGLLLNLTGRHESGVPLEVEAEKLADLRNAPGAELVNFERARVRPRNIFNFSAGITILRTDRVQATAQLDIQNLTNKFFAYNFGNPFEGTHFGHGRRWGGGLRIDLR